LTASWGIIRDTYRWNHGHFDMDFENMCLLTNELIKSNLLQEDYTFYKNIANMRYAEQLQKSEKRKASIEKAKRVKKAKVRNTECILEVV
jgi:hypothetical protein